MTGQSLRDWLRAWVAEATGLDAAEVSDDRTLDALGLSSRDVVLLSGELEKLTGLQLDATVAYEHPTIAKLADYLLSSARGGEEHAGHSAAASAVAASAALATPADHDIAIVGMAARFPDAEDLSAMWETFISGHLAVGDLPLGRWSEYASDEVMTRKMAEVSTKGGYLKDIAEFDAEFFGLSPLEAANMDPQQRIVLELTWEALEHAHIPASSLRGSDVGVFVGSTNNDYGMMIASDPAEAHPYALTGTSSAVIPNRVSYAFDFRGPSLAVDTACSSSLVAVHQAVRALRGGEASVAIAGGVNLLASPFVSTAFGELGVISPSGAIHAFSEDADGFVRSDGAGLVVLKKVRDAIADGDTIHAVIKGTAVNSDGRSNGITAPNPDAQVDVLQRAYADAGVDPAAVDYVEAHGTGTILGDPIEAGALGQVLGQGRDAASPLLLGSAKTNFGHSEAAAGAAGLIKVVLGMNKGIIPPSINYSGPNPYIDFDREHLEVVQDPREWPAYSGRPVAGVSGFGFGGTNAHAVVSQFVAADYADSEVAQPENPAQLHASSVLLPVSGLLPSRTRQAAGDLAEFIENSADFAGQDEPGQVAQLTAVARSLAGRNHGRTRAVIAASNSEQACKRLRLVAEGKKAAGIFYGESPATNGPVFVYSGFGSQHRKMAKDVMADSPFFASRIRELDRLIIKESGWSLEELIQDDSQTYDTETAQVAITAIQIALTDLMAHLGITPGAVMGMSMGEIAAAYAAGGLSDEHAMQIACHRSRLMGEGEKSLPEDQLGAMAVVEFSVEGLDEFIAQNPDYEGIEPAVYAGPGMTTVGGPREKVQKLVEYLEGEKKFARLLNVKGAGHTSAVDPLLGELGAEIAHVEPLPLRVPLYSSVDRSTVYHPGDVVHGPDYWIRCTRGRVWFMDATIAAFEAGHTMLVEISPNPVAMMGMMNTAFSVGKPDAQLLFALKRKVPASDSLADLAAAIYVTGQPVRFDRIVGAGRRIVAPGMRWKKDRYWTAARPSSGSTGSVLGHRVSLPDGSVAYSTQADMLPSAMALFDAAVAAALPGGMIVATEEYAPLPPTGEITTVVTTHMGGVSIAVYRVAEGTSTKVAEGFATALQLGAPTAGFAAAAEADAPAVEPAEVVDSMLWDPASGESVEARLRSIVSESMGYDVEDLPGELPLIDLGLDSLMGMRIKNRIEHDFQIPPLQVQALRDASVADVVTIVEDLVREQRLNTPAETAPAESAPAETAEPEEPAAPAEAPSPAAEGAPQDTEAVAPRDASERLVFATWAGLTGAAARGVTSQLPTLDHAKAEEIAQRLSERSGATITAAQVAAADRLEELADLVREGLETEVEGNIRVLRARPEGSTAPAVFMFHPAGGSSVVYQPLMRRLPDSVPVYGVERLEGPLEQRAAAYLDEIKQLAAGRPIILGGWSFGGALAYEVAHQLVGSGVEVAQVVLLDTVQPAEPVPDTPEETRARWERYAAFAKKTYGLDFPVPYELLESAGEDALLGMLAEFLSSPEAAAAGVSAGVLEHQRASFVDNRILDKVELSNWADVQVPVMLFRAERMHDGALELEPRYHRIDPDGGWSAIVEQLEIIQLHGDHLAIIDEPEIATVGAHLTRRIEKLLEE